MVRRSTDSDINHQLGAKSTQNLGRFHVPGDFVWLLTARLTASWRHLADHCRVGTKGCVNCKKFTHLRTLFRF